MLGTLFTSAEEISEFDFGHRSAGCYVGFVNDEGAAVVLAAEKPSVAIFAVPALRDF